MRRLCSPATALVLIAAAALPPRASAQEPSGSPRGPVVGFGAGVSGVRDSRTDQQGAGAALHMRAGWRLGRGITPMVEAGAHRMFDELLPARTAATSRVLKTWAVLASVQVELPRAFYVRPGVGVGDHAYAVTAPAVDGDEAGLPVRHESGRAAGLALGRTIVVARVVPVAIEGVALWSKGGESTGTRWSAGIQAVALLRF